MEMTAAICTKYGPPDVLRIAKVPKPTPKPNEVLVRVVATSVTASDCIVRSFDVPWTYHLPMALAIGFGGPRNPILGMVFAGIIEATGRNVERFRVGDHVYGCDFDRFKFGMYAEYACLPQSATIAPKPSNLGFLEAAALPYGGILASHFLRKSKLRSCDDILVYGASGAIGTLAVQLAKHFGAKVTGVCGTANRELVASLGADQVVDYTKEDFAERGARYDIVLNAVGKRKARLSCKGSLKPRGVHLTVDDGHPKPTCQDLHLLKRLAESGAVRPVLDRTYPLERIVEAHSYVDQGRKRGNVGISIQPEPL